MKATISDNDGFKYLVEVKEVDYPKGYTHVKFSTQWDGATRDSSEQKKFELFLTEQQRANLKDLL